MLIFVRHGRTVANATGLLQGRVDNALDELGRRQAAAIAASLPARPLRVVASPLRRARETAEAFGLPVQIDERFIELDYGVLDEMPLAQVPAALWAAWRADPHYLPEGGESLSQLQLRVEAACEEWSEEAAKGDVVIVAHVSPIKAAVAWALGVGPATSWRMHLGQATITRIRAGGGTPSLVSFNEEAHLRRLTVEP